MTPSMAKRGRPKAGLGIEPNFRPIPRSPAMPIPRSLRNKTVVWIGYLQPVQPVASGRDGMPRCTVPIISWPRLDGGRQYDWCFPWVAMPMTEDAQHDVAEPPLWTTEDVILWLRNAMWTLRALPANHTFPADYRSCMPAVVRSFMDAYDSEPEPMRDVATREAIARMDIALGWLEWLPYGRDKIIVTGCAVGASRRRIARYIGKSHPWVVVRNRQCLELIAHRLNGARAHS